MSNDYKGVSDMIYSLQEKTVVNWDRRRVVLPSTEFATTAGRAAL